MPERSLRDNVVHLPVAVARASDYGRQRVVARSSCLRRAICAIDALLRRAEGVFEFSTGERCLLRIALRRANATLRLADGVLVERGDTVIALHLWNEHLPPLPEGGANFAWVNRIRQQMTRSLMELATVAEENPALGDAAAFHARIAFVSRGRREKMVRISARFGFGQIVSDDRSDLGRCLHDFLENFWLWGLVWAFNPRSLRHRALVRQRDELWISKAALIERYGSAAPRRTPAAAVGIGGPRPVAAAIHGADCTR